MIIIWLWHHHLCNHYSYNVIRVTRSSTNLCLHYFVIKCNLYIKILQRGKNTKNMKFVENYKFQKIFRCWQQNSHCQDAKPWKYKLKVTKTQHNPQQFILSEIFKNVWVGGNFNWKFFKISFFPSEMRNFRLFKQARARCEVIVKYTNCNLLEHEWIRTGIRTLKAQIDEKKQEHWSSAKCYIFL